jgi:deoxyribonuclease V
MRADTERMRAEQLKLADEIVLRDGFDKAKLVAGCDCAFENDRVIAVIAVLEFPSMAFVEAKHAVQEGAMPYIPGYLGYRVLPAVSEAFSKLKNRPDVMVCDADGILHPRRLGAASHIGIALDLPTIGITKKPLLGQVREGKVWADGEIRAFEVKTKDAANPIYVSPGHKVSLGTALKLVIDCIRPPHKMPEPLHVAHKIGNRVRKGQPRDAMPHATLVEA